MAGNPPPVDLRAVCYVASNNNGDKENKQQKPKIMLRNKRDGPWCEPFDGVDTEVCKMWWWCMLEEGREGRKEWKVRPSKTPQTKGFKFSRSQKAHEPPESERFLTRKIAE